MPTPYKVTPEVQANMLRLWNEGATQAEIATKLGLHATSVAAHLRKLLGVETPEHWKGGGRVALQRPAKPKALPPHVVYPDNPPRLSIWCELQPGEATRFWSKVAAPNEFGCRLWLASTKVDGAGQFGTINSSSEVAYRVAWRLTYGPIPEGKNINHRCDNRPCCEPTHLWLGTQAQNLADMAAKGRRRGIGGWVRAEQNPRSKLTWALVREIRKLREEHGVTLDEIVERFGISKSQASNITTYKQWVE